MGDACDRSEFARSSDLAFNNTGSSNAGALPAGVYVWRDPSRRDGGSVRGAMADLSGQPAPVARAAWALQLLRATAYVAVFSAACALACQAAWRDRSMNVEGDAYLSSARAIAHGGRWPLVGGEIPPTPLRVGPAYEHLVALLLRVSDDPDIVSAVAVAGFGAAVLAAAVFANRWFGPPWGFLAALLMGLAEAPATVLRDSAFRHHEMVFLPLTLAVGALVEWARGRGDRAFFAHHAALAVATQMHAMTVVVVYASVAVAGWIRPPVSRRGLALGAAAWLVPYATWLAFFARHPPKDWGGAPTASFIRPDAGLPWLLVGAAVALHAATLRGRGPPAGSDAGPSAFASPERRALLVALASPAVNAWLGSAHWQPRYDYVFLPAVSWVVSGAVAVSVRALRAGRGYERAAAMAFLAVAALGASRLRPVEQWAALTAPGRPLALVSEPSYAEQVAIVRALRDAGFARNDLLARVHGWNRLASAQNYLGQWLLPRGGGDHLPAVLVGACSDDAADFGIWWRRVGAPEAARDVVVYAPRIGALEATVFDGGRPRWRGPLSLPCTTDMRCSGVQPCAPSASLGGESGAGVCPEGMTHALRDARAPELRVGFALRPASDARVIAVSSSQPIEVGLRVERGSAVPVVEEGFDGRREDPVRRWSVRTATPDAAGAVEVTIRARLPDSMWLDVYELPASSCATWP